MGNGNDDGSGPTAFSVRLRSAPDFGPIVELPAEERERLARGPVDATLQGFRLVRLLGVGPVTAAYEAVRGATGAEERAVLRLMIGNVARHDRSRSLFLRAAYAANRFTHPRVLPVTLDGTDETGAAFVVRPWVDGEPLKEHVRLHGPMQEKDALRVAEQVLDGLEMAHAHGIVHGAVSPTNVLVTPRGSARLCDFANPPGLVSRDGEELDPISPQRIGPTTAPERCASPPLPLSESADLYALGATLFFALTGEMPRTGASTREALASTAAQPLQALLPGASDAVAAIIDHALRFDPVRRYDSAYSMLGDVRRALAGRKPKLSSSLAPPPSSGLDALSGTPSMARVSQVHRGRVAPPPPRAPPVPPQAFRAEWKSNVLLILAIAALVGVATFVVVRDRVAEDRRLDGAPAAAPTKR